MTQFVVVLVYQNKHSSKWNNQNENTFLITNLKLNLQRNKHKMNTILVILS